MKSILRKLTLSKLSIILIIIVVIWTNFNLKDWYNENKILCYDMLSYYAYLPATFIHKDIKLKFLVNPKPEYSNQFWPKLTENKSYIIMTTMGMSVLYSPFFLFAHFCTKNFTNIEANGFTYPYKFMLVMSSIFYLLLGLFFLRKLLIKFFPEWITAFTLIIIVFGTNLFCYTTTEPTMSHAYSFALISILLFIIYKWYNKPNIGNSILAGLVFGLILLIRPTNIIVGLIFILWNVTSLRDLGKRLILFRENYLKIIIIITVIFLLLLPQLLYWHLITDKFLYYSYGSNERFFFNDPKVFKVLFSYRKGWFVYTPIMLVSVLSFPLLFRYFKQLSFAVPVYFLLNLYIISSWWCWWYGGSFGSRPFIDSYGIMAIPVASFLCYIKEKKSFIKTTGIVILFLLISLNIFNTMKYRYGSIHWDSMTKATYWKYFIRFRPDDKFKELIETPDYDKAREGIR